MQLRLFATNKFMRTHFNIARNSLQTLRKNRKRTMLSLLGIVVGTGVLVLVLSLGKGLEGLIMSQLGSFSPNTIMVEVQTPSSSKAGVMSAYNIKTLNETDMDDILKIEGITHISGWYTGSSNVKFGRENKNITALAVNTDFPFTQNLPIAVGRFFNKTEDKSGEKVVVIGLALAQKLTNNNPKNLLDQKVKLDGKFFRVVGITEELDSMGPMSLSDMIFLPLRTGSKHLWADDHLQAIILRMDDITQADRISWRIQNVLRNNHDIQDPKDDDFAVRTFSEMMEIVGTITSGINLLLSALAAISLLVGGVGIMNVMYVTVSERTKEIGLRKAVGAGSNLILFQFLFEAVVLTALGGIIGATLGITMAWFISLGAGYAGFDYPFAIPWTGIIGAVIISSLIGIIFGITPARKAALLEPIAALRAET